MLFNTIVGNHLPHHVIGIGWLDLVQLRRKRGDRQFSLQFGEESGRPIVRFQKSLNLSLKIFVACTDSTDVLVPLSFREIDQVFEDSVYPLLVDGRAVFLTRNTRPYAPSSSLRWRCSQT